MPEMVYVNTVTSKTLILCQFDPAEYVVTSEEEYVGYDICTFDPQDQKARVYMTLRKTRL